MDRCKGVETWSQVKNLTFRCLFVLVPVWVPPISLETDLSGRPGGRTILTHMTADEPNQGAAKGG